MISSAVSIDLKGIHHWPTVGVEVFLSKIFPSVSVSLKSLRVCFLYFFDRNPTHNFLVLFFSAYFFQKSIILYVETAASLHTKILATIADSANNFIMVKIRKKKWN